VCHALVWLCPGFSLGREKVLKQIIKGFLSGIFLQETCRSGVIKKINSNS
jgi:hypothetical protein